MTVAADDADSKRRLLNSCCLLIKNHSPNNGTPASFFAERFDFFRGRYQTISHFLLFDFSVHIGFIRGKYLEIDYHLQSFLSYT